MLLWRISCCLLLSSLLCLPADRLPGTQLLSSQEDLSKRIIEEIDAFLLREIDRSIEGRSAFWNRNNSSRAALEKSVEPNRGRFRKYIGLVEQRLPVRMEYIS